MVRPKVFQKADHELEIVEWLVEGKPLAAYARQPGKPSVGTIYVWARDDDEWAKALRIGRQWGTHTLADRALDIAMHPMPGEVVTEEELAEEAPREGKDGKLTKGRPAMRRRVTVTDDMLGHRRLLVDTILKFIRCWNSGEYGERVAHEHEGKLTLEQLVIESGKKPEPPTESGTGNQ